MGYDQAPAMPYDKLGIPQDGDIASKAIPSGRYVIWKGESYFSKTDIAIGDTLSSSNLLHIDDGIINEIMRRKVSDKQLAWVEDGDVATHAIWYGQFVIWKEKLHTADRAISVGESLYASGGDKNLTASEHGGLNSIQRRFKLDYANASSVSASNGGTCTIPFDCFCVIRLWMPAKGGNTNDNGTGTLYINGTFICNRNSNYPSSWNYLTFFLNKGDKVTFSHNQTTCEVICRCIPFAE